jgi:hypothetical protein
MHVDDKGNTKGQRSDNGYDRKKEIGWTRSTQDSDGEE